MDETLRREDVARRIRAARILRGVEDQDAFAQLLRETEGIPRTAYGQLERGERDLQGRDRGAIAKALNLPEEFFTDPLDQLLNDQRTTKPELQARLSEIQEQLSVLADRVEVLVLKQREPPTESR